jgi:hypothetical protein
VYEAFEETVLACARVEAFKVEFAELFNIDWTTILFSMSSE